MGRTSLAAAGIVAALALGACSAEQPDAPAAAAPSPTAPPHYAPFIDGRLCDSVRYDLLEGVVVDDNKPTEPFNNGLGLICVSQGGYHIPTSNYGELPKYKGEKAMIGIQLYVFDDPDQ